MEARTLVFAVVASVASLSACSVEHCEELAYRDASCAPLDAGTVDLGVPCATDADCAGAPGGPVCDPSLHACVPGCASRLDCPVTTPHCGTDGRCHPCEEPGVACDGPENGDETLGVTCLLVMQLERVYRPWEVIGWDFCTGGVEVDPGGRQLWNWANLRQLTWDYAGLRACANGPTAELACPFFTTVGVGQIPQGGACIVTDQCATGACEHAGDATCDGHCTAPSANGVECNRNEACASGSCDEGFCADPAGDVGQPCISGRCMQDLTCTSGTCTAPGEGQPCTVERCAPGLACDLSSGSVGTCVHLGTDGEHCNTRCATGFVCDRETCRVPRADGDACTLDSECADASLCFAGACRYRRVLRERCDPSLPCAPGLECDAGRCAPLPLAGPCVASCLHGSCVDGHCTELGLGAACPRVVQSETGAGEACGPGLRCSGATADTLHCTPVLPDGAACDYANYCNGGTSHCDPVTLVCESWCAS